MKEKDFQCFFLRVKPRAQPFIEVEVEVKVKVEVEVEKRYKSCKFREDSRLGDQAGYLQ